MIVLLFADIQKVQIISIKSGIYRGKPLFNRKLCQL